MSINIPSCKIVLIGDSNVGKTCIISRYIKGKMKENPCITILGSLQTKIVNLI